MRLNGGGMKDYREMHQQKMTSATPSVSEKKTESSEEFNFNIDTSKKLKVKLASDVTNDDVKTPETKEEKKIPKGSLCPNLKVWMKCLLLQLVFRKVFLLRGWIYIISTVLSISVKSHFSQIVVLIRIAFLNPICILEKKSFYLQNQNDGM